MSTAQAQTHSGSSSDKQGNDYAGAARTDLALVSYGSSGASASISKTLDCTLFKSKANCASVNLDSSTTGSSRAKVQIAGKTVYSVPVLANGQLSFPETSLDVFSVPPGTVVSIGLASILISGKAAGAAKFDATWNVASNPPTADLIGSATTYGNGTGVIDASILFGAASVSASGDLRFFNTTVALEGTASQAGISKAHATFTSKAWQLLVTLKVKLLWVISVAEKKLANYSGTQKTVTWF